MPSFARAVLCVALLALSACTPPPVQSDAATPSPGPGAKADAYGDPLPPGVLARFGTPRLTHTGSIHFAAVHPSGKLVATLSWDICLWDLERGTLIRRMLAPRRPDDIFPVGPREVAFTPDGRHLVTWGTGHSVCLFNVETGACEKELTFGKRRNECLDFCKDPGRVLIGHDDGTVTLATLPTGEVQGRWKTCGGKVERLRLHPDGRRFFVVGGFGESTIRLWSLESGKEEAAFPDQWSYPEMLPGSSPSMLIVTADGKYLVGGMDDEILVFDVEKRSVIGRKSFKGDFVSSLELLPEGNALLSGHRRGILREWTLPDLRLVRETTTDSPCVNFLPLPPEGERLLSWRGAANQSYSGGPRLQVRDRRSGKPLPPLQDEHRSGITSIDVSPDGRRIASGSLDGTIRIWDSQSARALSVLRSPTGPVGALAFLPGGREIISVGSQDSLIRVWDLDSGGVRKTATVPGDAPHEIELLVWASDGTTVVCERAGTLWAIDLASGAVARSVTAPSKAMSTESVHDILRDTGKSQIIYVATDSGISVWDTTTDDWAARYPQSHPRRILQSAFLPADTLLVSTDAEKHELQNLKTRKRESLELEFGRSISRTVLAMSPQGSRLAAAAPTQFLGPWGFERGAKLQIRDLRTKRPILELSGHDAEITHVRWLDERRVLTASRDLTLMIWDIRLLPGPEARKRSAEISAMAPGVGETAITTLLAPLDRENLDERLGAEEVLVALGDRAVGALRHQIRLCLAEQEEGAPGFARASRDLGDADPEVRERASRKLRDKGLSAVPALREAASSADAEVRVRVQALLDSLWTRVPQGVWRAGLTSVDLLEWIGTPAALEVLREVAAEARLLWISDAARDALRRLRG
jgi:WD40 repeat protein